MTVRVRSVPPKLILAWSNLVKTLPCHGKDCEFKSRREAQIFKEASTRKDEGENDAYKFLLP